MAIATASTSLKLHEFPSGNFLHTYEPASAISGPIRSISWSKDGNWLALVPYSGHTEIISLRDQPKLIHTIRGIQESLCASFQNATRKNVVIGTKIGQVLIYDIKAKKTKKTFPRAPSEVNRIDFTAKDSHVVAACESGEVFLYSNTQTSLSGCFKVPRSQSVSALRTHPTKRNYLVAGSNEGVVAIWDIHSNKHKFFNGSHKAPITGVAFSPMSSDVVVSTGLDRQFCFYDIGAGKCIGSIFVESNMTAVDFSPDGKFVVMASQKGKIFIYDVKNTHQPLASFEGHNGRVEHLLFRKSEDSENSLSISADQIKEDVVESDYSGSLGINMTPQGAVNSPCLTNTTNVEDSFLAAMGMDQNNTADSNKQDSYIPDSSRKFFMHKFTPPTNTSKALQDRINTNISIPITSTPDFIAHSLYPESSPIVSGNSDENKTLISNLEPLLRGVVKEEMQGVVEQLMNEMKHLWTYHCSENRTMILDLLMFNVKEFIKVENNINNLRTELVDETAQDRISLLEENFMLKQRIAQLEQQLAISKMNEVTWE